MRIEWQLERDKICSLAEISPTTFTKGSKTLLALPNSTRGICKYTNNRAKYNLRYFGCRIFVENAETLQSFAHSDWRLFNSSSKRPSFRGWLWRSKIRTGDEASSFLKFHALLREAVDFQLEFTHLQIWPIKFSAFRIPLQGQFVDCTNLFPEWQSAFSGLCSRFWNGEYVSLVVMVPKFKIISTFISKRCHCHFETGANYQEQPNCFPKAFSQMN